MTTTPETARELLYRHGLPEDVIDGALCLHAQELATQIREDADLRGIEGEKHLAQYGRELADLIDPTRTDTAPAVVSAPVQPTTRADDEGDELVCVDQCGSCDACGMEPFGTPAEGWREASRFLRRVARTSENREGALHGARLIEAELRRMAGEEQPATETRCTHGCDVSTCPCLACEAESDCTCADAGDCFAPAGHYADCPQAEQPAVAARQDGATT
ncbi:hypothetical protein [Streptomyces sp. NPDC002547]